MTSSNAIPFLGMVIAFPKTRGNYTLPPTPEVIHLPAPAPVFPADKNNAARLRRLMVTPQTRLTELRRPRQVDTGKRYREWESAMTEARGIEVMLAKLDALATALEQGSLPEGLQLIKWSAFSRTALDILIKRETMPATADFESFHAAGIQRDDYETVRAAIMAMGDPDAGKERDAETMQRLEYLTDMSRIPGYFPTPRSLIEEHLLAHIEEGPDVKFLEPSAGKGSIASVLRERGAKHIDVVEWNHDLRRILEIKGFNVIGDDIFDEKLNHLRGSYDAIVANPPFEKGADAQHVRRYVEFLGQGGTLVSVMSASVQFQQAKHYVQFREWLTEQGGQIYKLPAGAFSNADRKTGVAVCYVVICKGAQVDPQPPLPPEPEPPRPDMVKLIREAKEAESAAKASGEKVDAILKKLYPDAYPEPEIKPEPAITLNPEINGLMQAAEAGFKEMGIGNIFEAMVATFNQVDIAEAEIELAMKAYPDQQPLMWGSFSTLRCRIPMTDMLYRAHCRELLKRIATGQEYDTATDAECLATMMKISEAVPMHDAAAEAYGKLFARLFPEKFKELGEASKFLTEKWEGRADDLIQEVRDHISRKLGKRDAPRPRLPDWMTEEEEPDEAQLDALNKEESSTVPPKQLALF